MQSAQPSRVCGISRPSPARYVSTYKSTVNMLMGFQSIISIAMSAPNASPPLKNTREPESRGPHLHIFDNCEISSLRRCQIQIITGSEQDR